MLVETEVGNHAHRLYGGAQYHRVMREFNLATRCLRLPTISEDEIANAAGMGETHDGVNFLRAASIISLEKARCSFDPLLNALRIRMGHTMTRLCPIAEFMLNHKRERDSNVYSTADLFGNMDHPRDGKGPDISQNAQFLSLVRTIYDKFVNECTHQVSITPVSYHNFCMRFFTFSHPTLFYIDHDEMSRRPSSAHKIRDMGYPREKCRCSSKISPRPN